MADTLTATGTPGIYRRDGGRRSYVVRYADPGGRRRERSARTLAEAKELRASLLADVARGEYRTRRAVSFDTHALAWVETYRGRTSRGLRELTRDGYRQELTSKAVPWFGARPLASIEPADVKAWLRDLERQGLAAATIRQALAPVRAMLADAKEDGLIATNPAAGLRVVTAATADMPERAKALTEAQLATLLDHVRPDRRLFVRFVYETGARISEAIAVRWCDVDLDRRRVHIRRRIRGRDVGAPKSGTARTVPLTTALTVDLAQVVNDDHLASVSDALVFPGRGGAALDPVSLLRDVLRPAARKAGAPWAGWHTLRHTRATVLFRHGANAKQVQRWLGHADPGFTLRVYVHLLADDLPDPDGLLDWVRLPSDRPASDMPNPGTVHGMPNPGTVPFPTDSPHRGGRTGDIGDPAERPETGHTQVERETR